MATSFKQGVTALVGGFPQYLWSNAGNWTNGVPTNGGQVAFNIVGGSNPSGYDDIVNLSLNSLTLTNGQIGVAGTLTVGTVTFGVSSPSLYSDSILSGTPSSLTIDAMNTGGFIGAFGAGAMTNVLSTTDPGEVYQADEGGEVVLAAAPNASSGYFYQNSLAAGTFAFEAPTSTISGILDGVAIGNSIALPGSFVSSVTFGTSSMNVVTNKGTTTFGDVVYSGTKPTGYTVSTDPTGLERITFATSTATSFQQVTQTSVGGFPQYLWSTAANWTNGVPANGGQVNFNIVGGSNPSGYDDIANLFLDSLTLTNGQIGVAGTLAVGTATFGASSPSLYSDSILSGAPSSLTIDAMNTGGFIGAFGAGAMTYVLSTTDPGEVYQADEGGEVVLSASPNASSGYFYQNSIAAGTFAFEAPSATIFGILAGVEVGDSIALPGSSVSSVIFGANSLSVVTNLGSTTFSNVSYLGNTPNTYTLSADPTGLQRITFASTATVFQQVTQTSVGGFPQYLWSTAANWTNGVPVNGGQVTVHVVGGSNPSGYDDIANLFLDSLTLTNGQIGVAGTLAVGTAKFGDSSPSLYSDSILSGTPSSLTIDAMNNGGFIGAFGAGALTYVLSTTDPGDVYQADEGGEVVLAATPSANSGYFYQNSIAAGTFAFEAPSATISGILDGVAIGDSIALPGSFVSSVTFGTSSLTVVTNKGTTTFSDVVYSGTKPTGYTVSADPTGLERITFAASAATSFQQVTQTAVGGFPQYLWSTAANWTNGVPVNGGQVNFNIVGGSNPSGYDNIANLFLDSLTLTNGQIGVAGTLAVGTATFGASSPSLYSDSILSNAPSSLTIDAMNTGGFIGAFGAGAMTNVLSTTDPGEVYQADEGGEVVLAAAPNASSGYFYQNSIAAGTFAFEAPTSTISGILDGVAIGNSIALPGTLVSSVTFGTNSLNVVTNLGTTTFSNVVYSGTRPTGYTVSADPTGLERITFAAPAATIFQQVTQTSVGGFPQYLWSTAANWTSGVPTNGGQVNFNIVGGSNPSGYDDIANLFLDSLTLTNGQIGVAGTLTVGKATFGVSSPSLYSDSILSGAPSSLTIDAMNTGGFIGAFGAGAITNVLSTTDPGEVYQADEGGEVVLTAAPIASSGYFYQNSIAAGTFAFKAPTATIAGILDGVAIGDSIALPGSFVSSVTFGTNSLNVVTNLGTTTFSNVVYSGTKPTGYTISTDPTGLERITFINSPATIFQQVTQTSVGGFPQYLWSTAANWTSGVPTNGGQVNLNIVGGSNPSGYDDIANLFLDGLTLTNGQIGVAGTLTVGKATFGASSPSLYSDSILSGAPSSLTIDAMNTGGFIGAFGAGAITNVLSTTDPGEVYQADEGGEVVLAAAPNGSSGYFYQNSIAAGTFAFKAPTSTIAGILSGVAVGNSIALPGSFVSSVLYGAHSLSVTTDLGTTTFSNVTYTGTNPNGYIVGADPSGLERITFVLCFCSGTMIETAAGDVAVEDLREGDLVHVLHGGTTMPVKWIGHRHIACHRHPTPSMVWPVRVSADAFGPGRPRRDLWLSPDHAVFFGDVLIPVKYLINGSSITQVPTDAVTYYHVELPRHAVLLAEGLPAESYLDVDDRSNFDNGGDVVRLFPNFSSPTKDAAALWEARGCAPLVVTGPLLQAARQHLAECARHSPVKVPQRRRRNGRRLT